MQIELRNKMSISFRFPQKEHFFNFCSAGKYIVFINDGVSFHKENLTTASQIIFNFFSHELFLSSADHGHTKYLTVMVPLLTLE